MLLLLACAADPPPIALHIAAPSAESTYAFGPIPVEASWPLPDSAATVTATLDGAPLADPLAILQHPPGLTRWLAELPVADLAPGSHTLRLTVTPPDAAPLTAESTFTWAPGPHRLTISVVDGDGAPQWARVVIHGAEGPLPLAGPDAGRDQYGREGARSSIVVPAAPRIIHLPPDTYTLLATRGIRQTVDLRRLDLSGDAAVTLVVDEAVATPGRFAADLHVHTGRSSDARITDAARFASLLASGLDGVVITDHSLATDPAPTLAALTDRDDLLGITGVEIQLRRDEGSAAHLNGFPVAPGAVAVVPWRTAGAAVGELRALTDGLVQLNHPRGVVFQPRINHRPSRPSPYDLGTSRSTKTIGHALFSNPGFERTVPPGEGVNAWMTEPDPVTGARLLDIDAMEILNRYSFSQYQEIRADWFSLMEAGWFITGTANSDSHAEAVELAGYPLSLVSLTDPPGPASLAAAVKSGAVSGTTGPILSLEYADGVATVTVEAAAWVPVPEVRLVVDGAVSRIEPLGWSGDGGESRRAVFSWPAQPVRWVLAEAGWPLDALPADESLLPEAWRLAAPGYLPVAFTNPVIIR